ncbi:MAG TPA: OmpA family protein [Crocinitomicaceae bacterium]|nr:OmpA family protein [Crocinitomicaceae bacterium]
MNYFPKIFTLLIAISISCFTFAQKEANIWYFGENCGVDFSSGKPVALTDGKVFTDEGCAVISNAEGKLLFYTDGISVWNSNHEKMPNGTDLKGDPSSTSSGVAVPKPNDKNIYYLFSVPATAKPAGLNYSTIDMRLENGLGNVTEEKNIKLTDPITERLTAVSHRDGKSMWVIAHKWESDEFLAFLVTENGVSKTPVVSKAGLVHKGPDLNTQGYMKANPDGSNLALALESDYIVEIFDFDNQTGIVSNPLTKYIGDKTYPYGIEFSPDGSLLYVSAAGTGEIYQLNLQAGSDSLILASMIKVGSTPNKEWVGALQIANDGKIYFPIYKTAYLGVIKNPNKVGMECGYENNVVELAGKKARLGLPTFIQNFFTQKVQSDITYFNPAKVVLDKAIILKNITFDFAKFTLKSSSFVELDKVVTLLKSNPTYKIALTGHTDNIGNKTANLTLSLNRANAVKEYLVSKGIDKNRITTDGKGSGQPVVNNDTDENRETNRRVEFVLRK